MYTPGDGSRVYAVIFSHFVSLVVLYGMLLLFVFLILPFTYFYHEHIGKENSNAKKVSCDFKLFLTTIFLTQGRLIDATVG